MRKLAGCLMCWVQHWPRFSSWCWWRLSQVSSNRLCVVRVLFWQVGRKLAGCLMCWVVNPLAKVQLLVLVETVASQLKPVVCCQGLILTDVEEDA